MSTKKTLLLLARDAHGTSEDRRYQRRKKARRHQVGKGGFEKGEGGVAWKYKTGNY